MIDPVRALAGLLMALLGHAVDAADGHASTAPDSPQGFGYKCAWFAVHSNDPAAVADALGLVERKPANWSSGLKAGYRYQSPPGPVDVFVTPAVAGWVFAIGISLPVPWGSSIGPEGGSADLAFENLFRALAHRFDDVQFFVSHRVVNLVGWARARHGTIERLFIFADGTVYANVGRQTPEEAALGFPDLSGLAPGEAEKRLFDLAEKADASAQGRPATPPTHAVPRIRTLPDESWTTDLAGAWSLDPTLFEERKFPAGVGIIGQFIFPR
jgi:hypothetical protein